MRLRRDSKARRRPRLLAAAFAVLALLLQSLAPVAILPPRGQAVHFAHNHHGHEEGERSGKTRHDAPSCPVCQALQAGGTSIAAPAVLVAPRDIADAAPILVASIEAPRGPALGRPRARAPPLSV